MLPLSHPCFNHYNEPHKETVMLSFYYWLYYLFRPFEETAISVYKKLILKEKIASDLESDIRMMILM